MISRTYLSIFLTILAMGLTPFGQGWADTCEGVFLKAVTRYVPKDIDYDWTTAIFLFGAEKYALKKGPEFIAKLDPYYASLASKIPQIRDPDKASLSLPASFRASTPANQIVEASRKFFSEEPRNSLGAINHVGSRGILGTLYPSSVWADSLIMSVLNQLRISKTNEEKERALKEGELILKSLESDTSGLYAHAYYPGTGWKFPREYHWARGNLWIALYKAEVLGQNEDLKELKKYYVSGKGFHTLIDDPSSPFESSATALYAYVVGDSDQELQQDLEKTLLGYVKEDIFTGVSGPTTAFPFSFYYRSLIPTGDYLYGTGAFLLWCSVQ